MSALHRLGASLSRVWSQGAASRTIAHGGAFVWGFAEGTLLFAASDLWVSSLAVHHPRRALAAAGSAAVGALAGGAVTYLWTRRVGDSESKFALSMVPGVDLEMVDRIRDELRSRGWSALLTGPLRGQPYKLYARGSAVNGSPLGELLIWSVPARLPRFLAVAAGTGLMAQTVRKALPESAAEVLIPAAFLSGWAGFSAWYFLTGPGRLSPGFGSGFGLELPRLPLHPGR